MTEPSDAPLTPGAGLERPSLWQRAAAGRHAGGSAEAPGRLPVNRVDVVVVGGGLVGLATEVMLAEAGAEVLVLEAREVAQGTTARSTAKVSLLQGTRLAASTGSTAMS